MPATTLVHFVLIAVFLAMTACGDPQDQADASPDTEENNNAPDDNNDNDDNNDVGDDPANNDVNNDLPEPPQDTIHCIGVAEGSGDNNLWVIEQDAQGNTIFTGHFFGTLTLGQFSHTAPDAGSDAFIALVDDQCEVRWAVFGTGAGNDRINHAELLPDGSIVAGGSYQHDARFGEVSIEAASDHPSAFLLTLDAEGNPLNIKDFPGNGPTNTNRVDVMDSGAVVAVVYHESGIQAVHQDAPDTANGFVLFRTTATLEDPAPIYEVSLVEGYCSVWGTDINPRTGQIFLSGSFGGTCRFGDQERTSVGTYEDVMVLSLDAEGRELWFTTASGGVADWASNLNIDPDSGDPIVSGGIRGPADFGNGDTSFTGGQDAFVIRLDAQDGSVVWRQIIGGSGDDFALIPYVDAERGQVYLTGNYEGQLRVDGFAPLLSHGLDDVFAIGLQLDDGTPVWRRRVGGSARDLVQNVLPSADASSLLFSGWYIGDDYDLLGEVLPASDTSSFFWSRVSLAEE